MLVWLQHEKDCFDNPRTYLPYMEGKAMFVPYMEGKADFKLRCKHSAISCILHKEMEKKFLVNFGIPLQIF